MSSSREAIQLEQSQQAKSLAWSREKSLIQAGFSGQGDWTKGQRAELVMGHRVKGFHAVEIHSRQQKPKLVRDASNYFFVADSGGGGNNSNSQLIQHRRRSRHGKARGRH